MNINLKNKFFGMLAALACLSLLANACGTKSADSKTGANDSIAHADSVKNAMKQAETDPAAPGNAEILIHTTAGDIKVLLYGDTPKHRDNFIKLAEEGYYNGTLFHRVINEFMVQAGDPDSKTAVKGQQLGSGGPDYTIPAEIVYPAHFHKRGALAAARQGDEVNPLKASSGSQFYIVTGKKATKQELAQMENYLQQSAKQSYFNSLVVPLSKQIQDMQSAGNSQGLQNLQTQLEAQVEEYFKTHPVTMPQAVKTVYENIGGTPHLDNNYTVFGEVISGMDTVEKIEKSKTDRNDRPVEDIRITSMEVIRK